MQEEMEDVPAEPFNPDDFAAAETVDGSRPEGEEDPLSSAGLFEGDIANFDPSARNAIRSDYYRWPDNTVPYIITKEFSKTERSIIFKAMKEYHDKTCIKFKGRTTEPDYIYIRKGKGCSSCIGRCRGKQELILSDGIADGHYYTCVNIGTVIHEFMHAVGFYHEQSRTDRDDFVTINYHNIKAEEANRNYRNFKKHTQVKINHLGEKYDYCSVMHYGEYFWSKVNRMIFSLIVPRSCSGLGRVEDDRTEEESYGLQKDRRGTGVLCHGHQEDQQTVQV